MLVVWELVGIYAEQACRNLLDEVLYGHSVTLLEACGKLYRVLTAEGVVGYAAAQAFWQQEADESLYRVTYRTDVLTAPDVKAPKIRTLRRFSRVQVMGESGNFYRVRLFCGREGFVVRTHLGAADAFCCTADAVCDTALSFLGVPYRWGGRSAEGVDCSGLVSLCYGACGVLLPRDTASLHRLNAPAPTRACRGDLVLFPKHVGILLTAERFVHASAALGFVGISSLNGKDPLFDASHVQGGYRFLRVLAP